MFGLKLTATFCALGASKPSFMAFSNANLTYQVWSREFHFQAFILTANWNCYNLLVLAPIFVLLNLVVRLCTRHLISTLEGASLFESVQVGCPGVHRLIVFKGVTEKFAVKPRLTVLLCTLSIISSGLLVERHGAPMWWWWRTWSSSEGATSNVYAGKHAILLYELHIVWTHFSTMIFVGLYPKTKKTSCSIIARYTHYMI